MGPSWWCSHGSWIYNYLCNQCLEPLKPAHGEVYLMQFYVIKFVRDLRQVGGFLRVFRFPPCYMYLTCFVPHMYLSFCVPDMYLSCWLRQMYL